MPKNNNKAFVLKSASNGTELVLGSGLERSFVIQFSSDSEQLVFCWLILICRLPPPPSPPPITTTTIVQLLFLSSFCPDL